MATIHGSGKAGQYAKSQATRMAMRYFAVAFTVTFAAGVVGGSIVTILSISWLARHLGERALPFVAWTVVGLLVLAALFASLLNRAMKAVDKVTLVERLKWIRGGQAEGLVAWRLRDGLSKDWHLFNNIELADQGDVDHVLVGPRGVFCISTKSHRGMFSTARNGLHLLNGKPTEHLAEAERLALELKRRIDAIAGRVAWVQPVLAVPFAFVEFGSKQHNVWVLHEDNLCDELDARGSRTLSNADVERVTRALDTLAGHDAPIVTVAAA